MLRTRDLVAALGIIFLVISDQSSNRLVANVHLAFYLPTNGASSSSSSLSSLMEPFDVDGDGTPEALVAWYRDPKSETQMRLQMYDLRNLHRQRQQPLALPFLPTILLESAVVEKNDSSNPVAMTVGQVSVIPTDSGKTIIKSTDDSDRMDHYFCGVDWHDASEKCSVHCPQGQAAECPAGERCYADTPCSAKAISAAKSTNKVPDAQQQLHSTPGGSWPSVFTVFQDGEVVMHSLTADSTDSTLKLITTSRQKRLPPLQLKLMWKTKVFANPLSTGTTVDFSEVAVAFLDAVSAGNTSGMLLVTGTITVVREAEAVDHSSDEPVADYYSTTFVMAINAMDGEVVWKSSELEDLDKSSASLQPDEKLLLLPIRPGTTSVARRRSLITQHHSRLIHESSYQGFAGDAVSSTPNCMREYKRSVLTSLGVLPHQYWSSDDVTISAVHFEHQSAKTSSVHRQNSQKTKNRNPTKSISKKLQPHRHSTTKRQNQLQYGRPNVVVTHNDQGIQVRALKNGRSLCHLTLSDQMLYADINHDGTLDSIQSVTMSSAEASAIDPGSDDEVVRERRWVQSLVQRVARMNQASGSEYGKVQEALNMNVVASRTPLCHLLALSGMPTKEELFSVNLCGRRFGDITGLETISMSAIYESIESAPLLLMEPSSRGGTGAQNHKGHDIVAAINTGTVSRFRGHTGRRVWQIQGRRQHGHDFPTWESPENVILQRVDDVKVIPSMRPILLVGDNSVALLSPMMGRLLATATFPQPSSKRPRLVDFDGDGTTDLLVTTTDAVWGYHIIVNTGASILLRIMIGLLIMSIMLAALRNKFGPRPGKRSTDL